MPLLLGRMITGWLLLRGRVTILFRSSEINFIPLRMVVFGAAPDSLSVPESAIVFFSAASSFTDTVRCSVLEGASVFCSLASSAYALPQMDISKNAVRKNAALINKSRAIFVRVNILYAVECFKLNNNI